MKITFLARELSGPFRVFVAEETQRGRFLAVDHLLVLLHLLRHRELDTATAARVCQRAEPDVRETLSVMERGWEYLDRGGTGRGTYWTLRRETHARLSGPGDPDRDRRLDWEAAKTRVLSVLKQRAESGESGLSNAEIRQITYLDRHQVVRLMSELRRENGMILGPGRGRHARYSYAPIAPGNDRTH